MKREAWLKKENLDMDCQMQDGPGLERERFVKYCKDEYHAEPYQVQQQARDAQLQKKAKVQSGMHSRWGAEMQRRLGSKVLWELVSFTGQFSVDFLTRVTDAVASQPDVPVTNSQQKLRAHALKCRGDYRWACSLDNQRQSGRSRFGDWEWKLLKDFDSDKLRRQSNDATIAYGHGRIKNADGSVTDIGAETGGLTRTILDNWVPPDVLSEADDDEYELVRPNVLSEADDDEDEPESRAPSPSSESEFNVRRIVARAIECANEK